MVEQQPDQFSAGTVSGADRRSDDTVDQRVHGAGGGSIAGKVTAAAGGTNLAGICANALTHGTNNFVSNGQATAADGMYTITGLAGGDYNVRFDSQGVLPERNARQLRHAMVEQQGRPELGQRGGGDGRRDDRVDQRAMAQGGSIGGKVTGRGGRREPGGHLRERAFTHGTFRPAQRWQRGDRGRRDVHHHRAWLPATMT